MLPKYLILASDFIYALTIFKEYKKAGLPVLLKVNLFHSTLLGY